MEEFTAWINLYGNEKFVKDMKSSMKNIKEDLFVRQHIEHIDYEEFLEEHEFTKERYMQVYEKIWASLRHDVWKECKRYCKIDRVSKVSS